MSTFWQAVLTSGGFSLIVTLIITRLVNKGFSRIDDWKKLQTEETFLLMAKIDKLGDLSGLMAKKLHDAGIINGDLEALQQEYKEADKNYDEHIRTLAVEVLRR